MHNVVLCIAAAAGAKSLQASRFKSVDFPGKSAGDFPGAPREAP